jgi:DNA (cytosine-5)-methyltransferase 1
MTSRKIIKKSPDKKIPRKVAVVDLFCGVGGLSHGFVQENITVVAGIDYDGSCKFAYEKNNKAKFYHKNLTRTPSKFVASLFPKNSIKVLVGCAPCTSFSLLTQKYKDHNQWKLLYSFARIIKDVRPHIVSMENVPRLLDYQNGKVFRDFCNMLEQEGYRIDYHIVNCPEYGIPQKRQRLILLASEAWQNKTDAENSFGREIHNCKKSDIASSGDRSGWDQS